MNSRAAVFTGDHRLEIREFSTPEPIGAEVLVRVVGCTLCASDLHSLEGRRDVQVPTILGHEIVGEIVAMGSEALQTDIAGQDLELGDLVSWSIVAHCNECFYCHRDLPQKCLNALKYGHAPLSSEKSLSGGLAEHCLLVPGTSILRLQHEAPLAVACPANCATATVAAAVASAGNIAGANIGVVGTGMLGLTASAMLHAGGAESVVCVDLHEHRLQLARRFGATHTAVPRQLQSVIDVVSSGHGLDMVFEFSGDPAAVVQSLESLRMGGQLILAGSVFPTPPIDVVPEQIVRRNVRLHGIHNYKPYDLIDAISFLSNHHDEYPFADLVSRWFSLDQVNEAFAAASDPGCIRVGVRP